MRLNLIGAFKRNHPFGTEIAFLKGLQRIGVHCTTFDPSVSGEKLDRDCDATIVFKYLDPDPKWHREALVDLPGKKILYQVDDLRFPHIKKMMDEMREFCDHALTFDRDGASMAVINHGYRSAKCVLLTADNGLYRWIPAESERKDIDVAFVGSITPGTNHKSRVQMLRLVNQISGINVVVLNEFFAIEEIAKIYNRSKIVLNHATDVGQPFGHGYGYQCRHFEAGFTKSCVLSNVIDNDDTLKNIETFDSEKMLIEKIRYLLDNSTRRQELAQGLYNELHMWHLPVHRAREIVEFITEAS